MRPFAAVATVAVAVTSLLVGWGGCSPALACSCVDDDLSVQYARADAVFTGRLVSREVEHPGWPLVSSSDPAVHVFAVEAVQKGQVRERQAVLSPDSSASCGLELQGEGPFLVLAERADDGQYEATLCGGTAALTDQKQAEVQALVGTPPQRPRPGEALAEPGAPVRYRIGGGVLVLGAAALLLYRRRNRHRAQP